jgi:Trypsin-like peptidase domain
VVALPVVPPQDRVVEIEAALGTGQAARYRYGSGFRLGGRLVLTAAHVVAGAAAAGITVRGPDKVPHPARVVDGLAGDPDTVDLALLELCDQSAELPPPPVAAVDRNAPVPVPVEGCWAVGYPLFQEVGSAVGVVRETAQVWGMILPAENLVSGLLSLQVTSAPRALPPEQETLGQSQWSGMSGAAVVAGERLIGVVSEHAPRRGKSTIAVEAAGGILDPLTQRLQTALAQLRQVPEDLGEVYELVYAFIRKGGKLPVYARWIEGEEART